MPESDGKTFQDFFNIYQKYRSLIIMYDEEWEALISELSACAVLHNYENNPLTWYLYEAIIKTFDEMYRNGKQPALASFLGRDDL